MQFFGQLIQRTKRMANRTFDIPSVFAQVFGRGLVFPELLRRRAEGEQLGQEPAADLLPEEERNLLSFSECVFDDQGTRLRFDPPPVISVAGQKTIVSTPVAGKDFTVKEIISAEDFRISFRGFLFQDEGYEVEKNGFRLRYRSDRFPEEKLQTLQNFYRANRAIKVENDYLRMLGIEQVVIQSINYPPTDGLAGLFAYEIEALSDNYIELQVL